MFGKDGYKMPLTLKPDKNVVKQPFCIMFNTFSSKCRSETGNIKKREANKSIP